MQGPTRVTYAGRIRAPAAVVVATGAVALMFVATPFLIAPIAERYGVSEGTVGLVSVVQVGAFAAANFALPRLLWPTGRILRIAAAALVLLNLLSLFPSVFGVLLVIRAFAGFAAGAMTWLAWTDAMQHRKSMTVVAAATPVAILVGAPILSALATLGDQAVYLFLALATIPSVILYAPITGEKRRRACRAAARRAGRAASRARRPARSRG